MKQLFAGILLLVISFQVLPVKQVGKLLLKGQLTEDVHGHHDDSNNGDDLSKIKKADPFSNAYFSNNYSATPLKYFSQKVTVALQVAEQLPDNHVPDILTPPPNC